MVNAVRIQTSVAFLTVESTKFGVCLSVTGCRYLESPKKAAQDTATFLNNTLIQGRDFREPVTFDVLSYPKIG